MILRLLLLLITISGTVVHATDHDARSYIEKHFDIGGYIGYQMVFSGTAKPLPLKSTPELGLLINYDISKAFRLFTQFKYDQIHPEQTIAYAFLEYKTSVYGIPVRLTGGKIRHHFGLYNQDRLNPRTRPGTIAPQAIYWDQLRFALTSGYGISLQAELGKFHLKYTIDAPIIVDNSDEAAIWTRGKFTHIESNFGGHQGINIDYIEDDWRLTGTVIRQDWGVGRDGINYAGWVGAEYTWNKWIFSLEADGIFRKESHSLGYSATVSYELNDIISVHSNFNKYKAYGSGPRSQYYTTNSNDLSVGFSIHKNEWELRADGHRVDGSVWVDFKRVRQPEYAKVWYYGAVSLVYHFD